jgi:hypothetical protein
MDLVHIFIGILLVIIIIVGYTHDKSNNLTIVSPANCICVFDIDSTITCSEDNARKVVDVCKENKCVLAINTARPYPVYQDLDLDALGLTLQDFQNDFYYGSYTDLISAESIANTKTLHMNYMKSKYKVSPDKMILFDDNILNITRSAEAGYKTLLADNNPCGLQKDAYIKTQELLKLPIPLGTHIPPLLTS